MINAVERNVHRGAEPRYEVLVLTVLQRIVRCGGAYDHQVLRQEMTKVTPRMSASYLVLPTILLQQVDHRHSPTEVVVLAALKHSGAHLLQVLAGVLAHQSLQRDERHLVPTKEYNARNILRLTWLWGVMGQREGAKCSSRV